MGLLNLNPNTVRSNKAEDNSTRNARPIFTKENVPSVLFKKGRNQSISELPRVRILPCFDYALYGTPGFEKSWVPFKTEDQTSYTQWAIPVKGYTYFGKLWANFLSPATLQPMGQKYPTPFTDPISDIRGFIAKNLKYGTTLRDGVTPLITPEEAQLVAMPKSKDEFAAIPVKPRVFLLCNALIENTKTGAWEVKVLVVNGYAYKLFTDILEQRPSRSDPEINPAFPDCLFGDITDPTTGCILIPKEIESDSGILLVTLSPSKDAKTLMGFQQYPVDDSILAQRYVLNDSDNVLDIWTYQQILDQLCKDPLIPIETLQKAMDYGAFSDTASLNVELRDQGQHEYDAIMIAMENKRQRASGGTNTNVMPNFANPMMNRKPIPQQPRPQVTMPHFTPDNTMAALKTAATPDISTTAYTQPKEINFQPVNPAISSSPIQPTVQQPAAAPQPTVQATITSEELKEFEDLVKQAQSGTLTGNQMSRYLELMKKAHPGL